MTSGKTMSDIRKLAKERAGRICRVCRVCDGRVCAGEVPGMGGIGTGAGFIRNVDALASVKVNMRTLHGAGEPDCSISLFGHQLKLPVLALNFQVHCPFRRKPGKKIPYTIIPIPYSNVKGIPEAGLFFVLFCRNHAKTLP